MGNSEKNSLKLTKFFVKHFEILPTLFCHKTNLKDYGSNKIQVMDIGQIIQFMLIIWNTV